MSSKVRYSIGLILLMLKQKKKGRSCHRLDKVAGQGEKKEHDLPTSNLNKSPGLESLSALCRNDWISFVSIASLCAGERGCTCSALPEL